MKREFVEGEYTIDIWVENAAASDEGDRVKAEIVIKRTSDGEVMVAFDRFVAGLLSSVTQQDAIRYAHREALLSIEAGFKHE